jgi:hypothetical protein
VTMIRSRVHALRNPGNAAVWGESACKMTEHERSSVTMKTSRVAIGLLVLVGAVFLLERQSMRKLQEENESLSDQLRRLQGASARPSPNAVVQTEDSQANNSELLRLRAEVTTLRSQTSRIADFEQALSNLQGSMLATSLAAERYESNAIVAGVMMENPDAIPNGHFFHQTSAEGQSAWYFLGTNTTGRHITTIRYGR